VCGGCERGRRDLCEECVELAREALETYTGTYRYVSPSITADVTLDADKLAVRIRAAWVPPEPMALMPLGGRRFGTLMGAFEFSTPSAGGFLVRA
jgi:hypothetical protein